MDTRTLELIGNATVLWNRCDTILDKFLFLYLETDAGTAELILEPMRSADKSKLLQKLVKNKETEELIKIEIKWFLDFIGIARENRNLITHRIGGIESEISDRDVDRIKSNCESMDEFIIYSEDLRVRLSAIIMDRLDRQVPSSDGETGPDEDRPIPAFEAPARPDQLRRFQFRT